MRCYGVYRAEPQPQGGNRLVKLAEVWAWDNTDAHQRANALGYFVIEVVEL
jgi:hypothetical protein